MIDRGRTNRAALLHFERLLLDSEVLTETVPALEGVLSKLLDNLSPFSLN